MGTSWLRIAFEWFLLGVLILIALGFEDIINGDIVIGANTRDLFDHIALIDQWSLSITEWNFPDGGTLVPPDIYSMILGAPFIAFGLGVAVDMALFLQIWLVAISGWVLGRRVGSGIVGGITLGLSPFVLGQAMSGETETLNIWPLALFAAALLGPDYKHWRWAGLWAALAAMGSWYYGAYAAIILGLWTLWKGKWFSKTRDLKTLQPIGIFVALIAVPAIVYTKILLSQEQIFRGPKMEDYLENNPRAVAIFSGDPAAWFGTPTTDASHVDSLSWIIVIAACFGLWAMFREKDGRWKGILLILSGSLLLSIGPILHMKGVPVWNWMPYRLLMFIPPLDLMRLPHRWLVVSVICLSIMAAKGTRHLQWLWALLITTDLFIFYLPERQVVQLQYPSIIDLYSGPVLELPARTISDDLRGRYLLWQREHRQPIPYSLLMQSWSRSFAEEPLVIAVTAIDRQDTLTKRTIEAEQFRQGKFAVQVIEWQLNPQWFKLRGAKQRLKDMGFKQICLHKQFLHDIDAVEIQKTMEIVLGVPFVETEEAVLWAL